MSIDDFGGLPAEYQVQEKFEKLLKNYKNKTGLVGVIFKTFQKDFILAFLLCIVGTVFSFASPFIINWILRFLNDPSIPGR